MLSSARAWTSVILAGKRDTHRHVVVTETEVLLFCDGEKAWPPSIKITVLTFLVKEREKKKHFPGCLFFSNTRKKETLSQIASSSYNHKFPIVSDRVQVNCKASETTKQGCESHVSLIHSLFIPLEFFCRF